MGGGAGKRRVRVSVILVMWRSDNSLPRVVSYKPKSGLLLFLLHQLWLCYFIIALFPPPVRQRDRQMRKKTPGIAMS